MGGFAGNPFLELPIFRKTRDGRYVVALDFYPRSKTDTLKFLRCTDSLASIVNAILQWRADELEAAAAEEGLVLVRVRTTEEFLDEPQYTGVLSTMPLITVEKIGDGEPMPFTKDGQNPLDGIRAFGMGHVIAGAGMGRDLAMYGADVLNLWRPNATEVEAFAWDVQVGMRSTTLDGTKEDRSRFDNLYRSRPVHCRNSARHLPGNDRPGGHVANEGVIPNGFAAARFVEAAMAGAGWS
jgi:crotonobetainyl-CoA:carnitine CoA-transferase CaiB-like acyl-CoA transferase